LNRRRRRKTKYTPTNKNESPIYYKIRLCVLGTQLALALAKLWTMLGS
jgi:hypothetical protein